MSEQKDKEPVQKIAAAAVQAARTESEPAPVRRYRAVLFRASLVAAAVAFAGLTFLVKTIPSFAIDLQITKAMVNVFATLTSYSFPSGHVMFYTVFFGFIAFLAYSLLKPSPKRAFLLAFLGVLVALIGVSRIYLGEHWASDVLGSYLLGSLTLVAIIQFYIWGKTRFFVRQPVAAP